MKTNYLIHENEIPSKQLTRRSVKVLIGPQNGAQNMLLGSGLYDSGCQMPFHKHKDSEEIIYVISGSGEVQIGTQQFIIKPGSAFYVPPGIEHSVSVNSKERLHLIFVFSPSEEPGAAPENPLD